MQKIKTDRCRERERKKQRQWSDNRQGVGSGHFRFSALFYIDVRRSKFVLHSSVCRQREEDREAILRHKAKNWREKKTTTTNNGE